MAMTPENYRGLEKRSEEICQECSAILAEFDSDDFLIEERAKKAYDAILKNEVELEFAIRNAETKSIRKKYEACLENINSYKNSIYIKAHVM